MVPLQGPEPFAVVLAAARADAPWAYERLFEWLGGRVAGYLRAQRAHDPDDLANEVFLQVFTHLHDFDGDETRFRAWVFAIAHHRLIDERRRNGRRPASDGGPGADAALANHAGGDVEHQAIASLAEQRVRELLDGLTPGHQDVLYLRILGDLTVKQVAHATGRSPGAVKALQRRGLAALRRELERRAVPL